MDYVRVTEIIARLCDYSHIDEKVLKNKAEIGDEVHKAIEARINYDFYPLEEHRRLAYFTSYAYWHQKVKPNYIISEQRFYDDILLITGKVDAVIQDDKGRRSLIDFKTAVCEKFCRDGISAWKMQAHYYYHLLRENDIKVHDMQFIQLCHDKVVDPLGNMTYIGAQPVIFTYTFDQAIMDRCFDEAYRYWEERRAAISLD